MAGVTLENYGNNDEGSVVNKVTVPSISETGTAQVGAPAHGIGDDMRAEGVHYDSSNSVGVNRTMSGYPSATDTGESTNPLRP